MDTHISKKPLKRETTWAFHSATPDGFESRAKHLRFFNLYLNCDEERTKISEKDAEIGSLKTIAEMFLCVS